MKILWTHKLNVTIDLEYLGNLKLPQNVCSKKEYLRKISKNYCVRKNLVNLNQSN